ncbi:MAG TPA: hypothetical protein VLW75_02395 [Rhizomicrobium sp.]|nr:hypothetical protein [Rhizomicrobium sp.]
MNKDLAFIVSPGRTGTQFLGDKLCNMIEGAYSVHEPDLNHGPFDKRTWRNIRRFGFNHMVVGRLKGLTGGRMLSRAYMIGAISYEEAIERVRKGRERFFAARPEPLLIEANCQWALILPVLRAAFPRARFALITRDRKAWVESCMRRGTRYTEQDRVAQNRLSPGLLGDSRLGPRWQSMTPREKLEWEWDLIDARLTEFAKADKLSRLFRFEDLFEGQNRATHFRAMLDHIAAQDKRNYPIRFEPSVLEARINAS